MYLERALCILMTAKLTDPPTATTKHFCDELFQPYLLGTFCYDSDYLTFQAYKTGLDKLENKTEPVHPKLWHPDWRLPTP